MSSLGRPAWPVLVVFFAFAGVVAGAWAWFHVAPRQYEASYSLRARAGVPSFTYTNVVLTDAVLEALSISSNLVVNGTFTRTARKSERITVFLATWLAKSAREMSVVQHTPDICWVAAGAVPMSLGQPAQLEVRVGETSFPFECRLFRLGERDLELSIWCTLVNGQPQPELAVGAGSAPRELTNTPTGFEDKSRRADGAARRQAGSQFLNAIRNRIPGSGQKQFVRLSAPVHGENWATALQSVSEFAGKWLEVEVRRSTHGPGVSAGFIPAG